MENIIELASYMREAGGAIVKGEIVLKADNPLFEDIMRTNEDLRNGTIKNGRIYNSKGHDTGYSYIAESKGINCEEPEESNKNDFCELEEEIKDNLSAESEAVGEDYNSEEESPEEAADNSVKGVIEDIKKTKGK